MYQALTVYHNLMRWPVLASLLYALYRAYRGYRSGKSFSKTDNAVRHWTATVVHIQLVLGILLYTQSPVVRYFWKYFATAVRETDSFFFGVLHMLMMLTAVVIVTVGSAKSKRAIGDRDKFRIMLRWYAAALILILCAVPWPFSPLAARPYFR